MRCSVWIEGSLIRECIIPVHLATPQICPYPHSGFDCLFPDAIRTCPARGGGVLLPLSVEFCVLANLMSACNMVCRRDDVAGSISQNTLGIFSIPSPCQTENTLPVFHYLMWQELHTVHASVGSSPHIWFRSCQCQFFETGSKALSVKTALLTIFARQGWPAA